MGERVGHCSCPCWDGYASGPEYAWSREIMKWVKSVSASVLGVSPRPTQLHPLMLLTSFHWWSMRHLVSYNYVARVIAWPRTQSFLIYDFSPVSGESFAPCSFNNSVGSSLHVLLLDAKTRYEVAHESLLTNRNDTLALDYALEASAMYQQVLDSPLHPQISKCLRLTGEYLISLSFLCCPPNLGRRISLVQRRKLVVAHLFFFTRIYFISHSSCSHCLLPQEWARPGSCICLEVSCGDNVS